MDDRQTPDATEDRAGGRLVRRRLRAGELVALDMAAGLGYTLLLLLAAAHHRPAPPWWLTVPVAAVVGLPLGVRRRWPRTAFAVVLAGSTAGLVTGLTAEPLVAVAYATYPLAVGTPRRRGEPTLLIGLTSAAVLVLAVGTGPAPGTPAEAFTRWSLVTVGAGLAGGTWTVGRAVRERRRYAARAAEEGATRERLRIARELHDIVSHTLSLIGVRAGVAAHVAAQRPAELAAELRAIEALSRDALTEMRHMLGVLRADQAPLAPVPGVGELADIVERAALAGVRVDLAVAGVDGLPPALQLSVYRIVQEAVTNVVRHAAPARCRVRVEGTEWEVRVEVTDDGPGRRVLPGRPGHGLAGMRERAAVHGGTVEAGPVAHGGFSVRAVLPRS